MKSLDDYMIEYNEYVERAKKSNAESINEPEEWVLMHFLEDHNIKLFEFDDDEVLMAALELKNHGQDDLLKFILKGIDKTKEMLRQNLPIRFLRFTVVL